VLLKAKLILFLTVFLAFSFILQAQAVNVELPTTDKGYNIDWGTIAPGGNATCTLPLLNIGEKTITHIAFSTSNWQPPEAEQYFTFSTNYTNQTLATNETLPTMLTLQVYQNVSVTKFSFNIIITSTMQDGEKVESELPQNFNTKTTQVSSMALSETIQYIIPFGVTMVFTAFAFALSTGKDNKELSLIFKGIAGLCWFMMSLIQFFFFGSEALLAIPTTILFMGFGFIFTFLIVQDFGEQKKERIWRFQD
jgi:hypothetical protein